MSASLLSVGLRAMTANYTAIQTTSHNIANANVAGYSRQQVMLATSPSQYSGSGFIGTGVDVASVTRAHDDFLTHQAATATSLAAKDSALQDRLTQLQQAFPLGTGGLGDATSQFMAAMSDLASQPGDSATRQTVLSQAQNLASQFNNASSQFDSLQAGVTQDLKSIVSEVNGLAQSIAKVNQQISAAKGLGQPPNDLLDQRDRLVAQLSQHLQVSTVMADDNTMSVFIAGGQNLVLGGQSASLQVTPDAQDPSRSALSIASGGKTPALDPNSLGGGDIAGLLQFQNHDLVDARNLVGQMAAAVAGAVNHQQLLGANLQPPAGTVPSQPIFSIGAPQVVPNTNNAKDASGKYLANVSLTVTDPSALQASDYELRADPSGVAGQYQLTRLSNPPQVQTIVSGAVVDGMRIDIGVPAPSPTDRFLLQPVAQAAAGLGVTLQDPMGVAAASPLIASTAAANTGTASVASLTMLTQPPQPAATATVTFTNDSGAYTWSLTDASNTVLASGTGTWQAGQAIPTPPTDINGFALQLAGVPKSGDVITVQPTPASALSSNNGNARALASLRDATLVGQNQASNGTLSGGSTATDAYASAIANIGVRVQTAKSAATISSAVATQASQAASSTSGVNLDEEAARLIQYQQSYQAAAKVLQVAQSLFQTVLTTMGP